MTAPKHEYIGTCEATGKRMYSDRSTAKKVARQTSGRGLAAFRCNHCDFWHLGHRGTWSRAEHREHREALATIREEVNP